MDVLESEPVSSPLNIPVFSCGRDTLAFRDVMDFGWLLGAVHPFWNDLQVAIARTEHAGGLEMEPDYSRIQAMSEDFRYDLDLISAEEAERWLEQRAIDASAFSDFFLRRYWLQNLEEPASVDLQEYGTTPELRELLRVDLVLTGEFNRLSTMLAWRWAAASTAQPNSLSERELANTRDAILARVNQPELSAALSALGRDSSWVNHQLQLEAHYQQAKEAILTPENRSRTLETMHLPLIRFELERVEVPSLEAAKEALLCVREGITSLKEIAEECATNLRREKLFLDDATEDFYRLLLCTAVGDLMEPRESESGYMINQVVSRTEPDLGDPEVQVRIDEKILGQHFSELASKVIAWKLQ